MIMAGEREEESQEITQIRPSLALGLVDAEYPASTIRIGGGEQHSGF
jgi:hypothetical protein